MQRVVFRLAIFFVACLPVVACDSNEDELPSWREVRIQPRGVDGVEFGMTGDQVIETLGAPQAGSAAESNGRLYRVFEYKTAMNDEKMAFFLNRAAAGTAEPEHVDVINLRGAYTGRTEEGIGIGSSESDLRSAYGDPRYAFEYTQDTGGKGTQLVYCREGRQFRFAVTSASIIELISIAYYTPLSEDPYTCVG